MPKIDLHRHLVGSIRPEVLTYIANQLNITIPTFGNDPESIERVAVIRQPLEGGYRTFIQKRFWSVFQYIFSKPQGCAHAIYWAIKDASLDNVAYVEFRVSPYRVNPDSPENLVQFLKSLQEGINAAMRDCPNTIAKIILSIGRRSVYGKWYRERLDEYYSQLVATASDFRNIIVGFDLSGDEEEYPNHLFKEFARKVKDSNFKLTVHAGETGDPRSIWDAIDLLGADRIGHGLGLLNDRALLRRVVDIGVALELCPTSNWLLRAAPSIEEHPFGEFFKCGVRTTVNTDDPVLFDNTTMTIEFYKLIRAHQISVDDIPKIQAYSIDAIFADDNVKAALARKFTSPSVESHCLAAIG